MTPGQKERFLSSLQGKLVEYQDTLLLSHTMGCPVKGIIVWCRHTKDYYFLNNYVHGQSCGSGTKSKFSYKYSWVLRENLRVKDQVKLLDK